MPIPLLSPADQSHWGLFRQPFADSPAVNVPSRPDEFLFASAEQSQARIWLETILRNKVGIAKLNICPGVGATTWARQWMATHGLADLPLDVMGTEATKFDHDVCQQWLSIARSNRPLGIHTLCIVDGTPDQATIQWYKQSLKLDPRCSPMTLLLMGPETFSGVSHTMSVSTDSLARCLAAALSHAGQLRPRMTEPAAQLIAEWANGDYRQLAFWTHVVLAWGARERCQQIDERAIHRLDQQRQAWTSETAAQRSSAAA
ncbi:hypothetical protein [Rhodopirellula baltica]|uniref:Uncharacterized protein n=1 Tax=Rhodopirellula baltica WH47 TaxID=991778 RepID=F2AXE3_RHOBT|nr:hypothetical protein [Rhodopirellula baltica]EGF25655.1 hypothetical protein RBWH47_01850 [Rhodopirellula baltica WH47]